MKTAPLNKTAAEPAQPLAPVAPPDATMQAIENASEQPPTAFDRAAATLAAHQAQQAATPAPAKPDMLRVLDLSATTEDRHHEIMVNGQIKIFTFQARTAKELPAHIAVKFLRFADSFKLVDEFGELIPFQNTPKQPHEMQAGERFKVDREATIARFDELHTPALQLRVLQCPNGERFKDSRDRSAMIAFLIETTEAAKRKNIGKEESLGIEEWVPPPENDAALDTGAWA